MVFWTWYNQLMYYLKYTDYDVNTKPVDECGNPYHLSTTTLQWICQSTFCKAELLKNSFLFHCLVILTTFFYNIIIIILILTLNGTTCIHIYKKSCIHIYKYIKFKTVS